MLRFALILIALSTVCRAASTIAVLPLSNGDPSAPNLDWIGESAAENIHEALSSEGLLVLSREERVEVYRRASVRAGAVVTKATILKIGEMLDAGEVVYGEYKVDATPDAPAGPQSKVRIVAHVIDLKNLREEGDFEKTGPLETLSQMEMDLSWMVLNQTAPGLAPPRDVFMRDRPAIRVDAMESFVRGLAAGSEEQKIQLFTQATRIDDHFSQPNYQLGRLYFDKKDYKGAAPWLAKVGKADSHYMEASFLLGICRYYEGDFEAAAKQFSMVAGVIPLNEVFNNLGAALSRRNDAAALGNFRKALDGDEGDPDYWFNYGYALWKIGQYAEAADQFRAALVRSPYDDEATSMLGRCLRGDPPRASDPRTEGRERIKTTFEDSAFRQLQAELKK